ncbi:MAG: hypothetical protein ACXV48_09005, partial [Halobacteriota archaeon]
FWLAVLVCGADEAEGPGEYEVHPAVRTTAPTSAASAKSINFFIACLHSTPERVPGSHFVFARLLKCVVRAFLIAEGFERCSSMFTPWRVPPYLSFDVPSLSDRAMR